MGSRTAFAAAALCAAIASPAAAQTESIEQRLKVLEAVVSAQAARLEDQQRMLADQSAELGALRREAFDRPIATQAELADVRARGMADDQVNPASPGPRSVSETPAGPVGQAPVEDPADNVQLAALPENTGVLTPRGHGVIEPSLRYVHGSNNRLVFRGVEIVTGVQIGVIEASDADRTTLSPSIAARYGLTDRLEIEAVAPYVRRSDRITTLAQRDQTSTRTVSLDGADIGDVELGLRYQLNRARAGRPVFIGSLRYKSDTGVSPFEIDRDEFGVATGLATGSGFQGGQAGLSFLYPTDPAVIFGSIAYLYNAPKNIDRDIGGVRVGEVDPGDALAVSAGFGFALNPQFSFSLGYSHTYVDKTTSFLNNLKQEAEALQVGSMTFGWSLRLTPRLTLSNSYEFGVTSDAPDVSVVVRLPYRF